MKLPDDPVIQELIDEFVDTWIEDINEQFANLIQTKNADDLYRLAHTLKGSCFQFGLDEIAELGIELQGVAKDKDWEKAESFEEPLLNKFKEVKVLLEENKS